MELRQVIKKNNSTDSSNLKEVLSELNSNLYEKEEISRLCLLAALAGESVFMLGLPGTAKSMIARKICEAISSKEKYFEYLMNQFSTPDEIFGPVSLKSLENDEYKRITDKFLPTAEIAFLDEIWKAGPAIQNTLLTILNEKKFRNGKKVESVPLKAFFAASNELPAKNCGLEALFDRFLIRTIVKPIENEDNFEKLFASEEIENSKKEKSKKLNIDDYLKDGKYFEKINDVEFPEKILQVIHSIKKEIQLQNDKIEDEKEKFYVSDRRWKKIGHLLKTSAFANYRTKVDLMDLQLITYCIWSTEKQRELADRIMLKCIEQNGLECSTNIEEIEEQIKEFEKIINERFYKRQPQKNAEPIKKSYDGETYTKITYNNKECWISNKLLYHGDLKSNNFEIISSVQQEGKKITWRSYQNYTTSSGEICLSKPQPAGYVKDEESFIPAKYDSLARSSDIEYEAINKTIKTEIEKLKVFENKDGKAFRDNLFTNQSCYDKIMNKIVVEKEKLENLKVDLEKQKIRYDK